MSSELKKYRVLASRFIRIHKVDFIDIAANDERYAAREAASISEKWKITDADIDWSEWQFAEEGVRIIRVEEVENE